MDKVRFYFDPICPWCYQTSRWAKQLEGLGEIEVDWRVFSLEVVNLEEGKDPKELEARSGPALRTSTLIHKRAGAKAVGDFYTALGRRVWEQAPPEDEVPAVRGSLAEAGLDEAWCDEALADPATWTAVLDEHNALVDRTGSFGVPTIVIGDDEGPAIFGPVILSQPSDADAIELWRHVSGLTRYGNFFELKRGRPGLPDLPGMTWRLEQREARRRARETEEG
jgi:2-hydroxychromene-2-carboxylate isomerase